MKKFGKIGAKIKPRCYGNIVHLVQTKGIRECNTCGSKNVLSKLIVF